MLGASSPAVLPSANTTRRTFTRRAGAAGLVTALTGSILMAMAPASTAAAPAIDMTLTRNLLPGDKATATGTVTGTKARMIKLQRQLDTPDTWQTVASATLPTSGKYKLADTESRPGQYRVVLPKAIVDGAVADKVVSATSPAVRAAILESGRTMNAGQYLQSKDGAYQLVLRNSGNITLEKTADDSVVWQSSTWGNAGSRLVMQYKGNLVLVDPDGAVVWQSGTSTADGYMALYTSGVFVVRTSDGTVLWDRDKGLATPALTSWAERGMSWVDARVRYSQSRWYKNKYGNYRTDCSGFVSLMWGLSSSYTTRTIPNISSTISKASLRPGDVLNAYNYHVVLFDGWANAEKTRYYAFEQTPSTGATRHVIPYPYWSSSRPGSFVPRRLDQARAAKMADQKSRADDGGDAGPTAPTAAELRAFNR